MHEIISLFPHFFSWKMFSVFVVSLSEGLVEFFLAPTSLETF